MNKLTYLYMKKKTQQSGNLSDRKSVEIKKNYDSYHICHWYDNRKDKLNILQHWNTRRPG